MRDADDKDRRLAALAAMQWGVVSRAQLSGAGLDKDAVARRVARGRLHRLHPGVYAVGHTALRAEARWLAAALACGPGAVLSHVTAGAIWDLRPASTAAIDVTVPSGAGRAAPHGVRLHRHAALRPEEVTVRDGLPVTTPARTLLDLAATRPRRELERALDQAEVLQLFDLGALHAVADGRAGTRPLRAALSEHEAGTTVTRSELEELLLAVCARHGLPRPMVNARVAGFEVDALFPGAKLVLEADSWRFHGRRRDFERDRAKDARLAVAGFRVVRLTDRRLRREPAKVAAELRALLSLVG